MVFWFSVDSCLPPLSFGSEGVEWQRNWINWTLSDLVTIKMIQKVFSGSVSPTRRSRWTRTCTWTRWRSGASTTTTTSSCSSTGCCQRGETGLPHSKFEVRIFKYEYWNCRVTRNGEMWFHLARSAIAGFALYFMWTGIACVTGCVTVWVLINNWVILKKSSKWLGNVSFITWGYEYRARIDCLL